MSQVKDFLEDEILAEFDDLRGLKPGTDDHARLSGDICNMCKIYIEMEKMDNDLVEKENRRTIEEETRLNELKERRKEKIMDICKDIGIAGGTLACYAVLFGLGIKFEESGTFRSKMFTNLLNKLKPSQIK